MRSKVADRILRETPAPIRDKVLEYAKKKATISYVHEFVELYRQGAKLCELRLYVEIDYDNAYFKIYDKNEVYGIDKYLQCSIKHIDRSIAFCNCYRACLEFARKELGDAKD